MTGILPMVNRFWIAGEVCLLLLVRHVGPYPKEYTLGAKKVLEHSSRLAHVECVVPAAGVHFTVLLPLITPWTSVHTNLEALGVFCGRGLEPRVALGLEFLEYRSG